MVICLYFRNFLEDGLRGSRGPSHRHTPDPRRVFLSDQPPWILTRSNVSYKGSLQFTLLERIVNEMLYLSPPHGPGFYSPTLLGQLFFFKSIIGLIQIFGGANSYFCRLKFENIKINVYIFLKNSKFWGGHGPPTLVHASAPAYFMISAHILEIVGES